MVALTTQIASDTSTSSRDVALGAASGFVGGLAGTFAMSVLESVWSALAAEAEVIPTDARHRRRLRHAGIGRGHSAQSEPRSHEHPWTSSEVLIDRVADAMGTDLTADQRRRLGSVFHYLFGATVGAAYGAAAERWPLVTAGRGLGYGAAVWLVADEIGIVAAGLADPPHRTPPRLHAYSLAAHFAYGFGTEMTRRLVRRAFA